LLSGGKSEGVSGPGVGSVRTVVQAGGVGMTIPGTAGEVLTGEAGAGLQAVRKIRSEKKAGKRREDSLRILNRFVVFRVVISHPFIGWPVAVLRRMSSMQWC
jgi:hypothetical protein